MRPDLAKWAEEGKGGRVLLKPTRRDPMIFLCDVC